MLSFETIYISHDPTPPPKKEKKTKEKEEEKTKLFNRFKTMEISQKNFIILTTEVLRNQ